MSQSSLSTLPADDQKTSLDEGMHAIKVHAFHMNKCLNDDRVMEAIKHASTMLAELKTSALTPKNFYELYMSVFDQLGRLSSHLREHYSAPAVSASGPAPTVADATKSADGDTAAGGDIQSAARTVALDSSLNQPSNAADPSRHKLAELYEMVQYASSIVPRLFLMITVGTIYMSVPNSPKRDLMMDMLDMCKGVQHPTRGLFLRYYLQQLSRDLLPQTPGASAESGSLDDTIYFILNNFTEMNKLWVRLQHQGLSRDRARREQERRDLRILVGTNLVRLSQLDGLTLDIYKTTVLPKVLEQIVSCKDVIAQEYLLEAIIQVFQDDFHLWTLGQLLEATGRLQQQVNIKNIIISFIDRFTAYAKRERENASGGSDEAAEGSTGDEGKEQKSTPAAEQTAAQKYRPGIPDEIPLFEVFWKEITGIITAREDLSVGDATALLVSLMNLALNCYPERLEYVAKIYRFGAQHYSTADAENIGDRATMKAVLELIAAPLRTHPSILTLLENTGCSGALCDMLAVLPYPLRRASALHIAKDTLRKSVIIDKPDIATRLLSELMGTLVRDQKDGGLVSGTGKQVGGEPMDMEDVKEAQSLVARLVHLFRCDDADQQFAILNAERQIFVAGGVDRVMYTLPALMIQSLRLALQYCTAQLEHPEERKIGGDDEQPSATDQQLQALFKFMHQIVSALQRAEHHELALRLFLMPLQDPVILIGFEMIAYEFMVQAFTIYEDSISQSKSQISILHLMVGTLYAASNRGIFGRENYDTLATKCALYASRMLRKDDQCRLVLLCSHLFWGRDVEEADCVRMNTLLAGGDGATASETTSTAARKTSSAASASKYDPAAAMEEQLKQITPAGVPQFGVDEDDGMYAGLGTPPTVSPTAKAPVAAQPVSGTTRPRAAVSTTLSDRLRNEFIYRDGKRVLECLQKSLKIADSCMDTLVNVQLFTDILNLYIVFYDKGNTAINSKYVNGLVDLVFSHCQTLHSDPAAQQIQQTAEDDDTAAPVLTSASGANKPVPTALQRTERHFRDTLRHALSQKAKYRAGPPDQSARWNEISVVEDVLATVESWVPQ